jgi:hypothetical protein
MMRSMTDNYAEGRRYQIKSKSITNRVKSAQDPSVKQPNAVANLMDMMSAIKSWCNGYALMSTEPDYV